MHGLIWQRRQVGISSFGAGMIPSRCCRANVTCLPPVAPLPPSPLLPRPFDRTTSRCRDRGTATRDVASRRVALLFLNERKKRKRPRRYNKLEISPCSIFLSLKNRLSSRYFLKLYRSLETLQVYSFSQHSQHC